MEFNYAKGTIYRHYKGGVYEVQCIAEQTETGEQFVVYSELGASDKVWARPREMFESYVETTEGQIPRFSK